MRKSERQEEERTRSSRRLTLEVRAVDLSLSSNQPNLLNRLGWPGNDRRCSFCNPALDWGQRSETDMRDEYMRLGRVKLTSGLEYAKGGVCTTAHQNYPGRLL